MPIDLPAQELAPKKQWTVTGRFVLVTIVAFFAVVAGVNAIMMTLAIRTFPGADAKNGYDKSQNYNREIAAARAQHERGWQVTPVINKRDGMTAFSLQVRDKGDAPVTGLTVEAQFRHPSDKKLDHTLQLSQDGAGTYRASSAELSAGAWIVRMVASRDGETLYVSENRVTLR